MESLVSGMSARRLAIYVQEPVLRKTLAVTREAVVLVAGRRYVDA
jgi:hypothetical protein